MVERSALGFLPVKETCLLNSEVVVFEGIGAAHAARESVPLIETYPTCQYKRYDADTIVQGGMGF